MATSEKATSGHSNDSLIYPYDKPMIRNSLQHFKELMKRYNDDLAQLNMIWPIPFGHGRISLGELVIHTSSTRA